MCTEAARKNEVWKRFKAGSAITDEELDILIRDCQETVRLLAYKPEFGSSKTALVHDLCALQALRSARRMTTVHIDLEESELCTYHQYMGGIWKRYKNGDHLEDRELELLTRDTEQALQALGYRPDHGCINSELCKELQSMRAYLRYRRARSGKSA